MPDHRSRIQPFAMVEMVIAMGLLVLMLAGFVSSFHVLRRANTAYVRECHCVWVMSNTLERLAARQTVTVDEARSLLAAELAATAMPGRSDVHPVVAYAPGLLRLRLEDARGRPIVAVEVPCP